MPEKINAPHTLLLAADALGLGSLWSCRPFVIWIAALVPHLASAQTETPLRADAPRSLHVEQQTACQFDTAREPEMVTIEGGTFVMGTPSDEAGEGSDEVPQHRVTVRRFAMGRCEVTVDQFEQFIKQTGYRTEAEKDEGCFTFNSNSIPDDAETSWRKPGFAQSGTHPVVCVTLRDIEAYIASLNLHFGRNYRLPTEAEWEYAARGGTTTRLSFGDDPSATRPCEYANGIAQDIQGPLSAPDYRLLKCVDGYAFTSPTSLLKPNALGLYGMHGNAAEWVQDCYHEDYSDAPTNGDAWMETDYGDCGRRVLRGGAWSDSPMALRSASRNWSAVDSATNHAGFRLARSL